MIDESELEELGTKRRRETTHSEFSREGILEHGVEELMRREHEFQERYS